MYGSKLKTVDYQMEQNRDGHEQGSKRDGGDKTPFRVCNL